MTFHCPNNLVRMYYSQFIDKNQRLKSILKGKDYKLGCSANTFINSYF